MPLDVVRLLDSDLFALSTGDEFKAAVALWAKAWTQVPAGSLPNEDRILSHLSGSGRAWKKLKNMALKGFVLCDDDRWYHPVIAEKAKEAWAHRLKQRAKANKRWDSEKPERGNATADATAYSTAMQVTGTVEEEPLAKANAASGGSDQQFWSNARTYLKPFVKGDPGSLIGKWVKGYGKPATAEAITRAQLDRAVNPIEFIQGAFRKQASNGYGPGHSGVPV